MADHIVLVGMMGAARPPWVACWPRRLGWAFLDSDAMVEASTGSTVPELFATRGEEAFRAEESRVLAEGLASPGPTVVSAAGGVVLSPDNRALLAGQVVVWLRADPATLAARVGSGTGRPLLDEDPAGALVALDAVRRPLYEEVADVVVDVDDLDPAHGGRPRPGRHRVRPEPAVTTVVPVDLGERSYEVVVGDGARHELARVVAASVPSARRAVVVTQERIGVEVDPGLPFEVVTVPDGEPAKSLAHVEELCRRFARSGLSRADVVVAVGGGVVTDLAGFAAASFHRGTAYVNVATSLLAQVDAAIGGKTGVNLPEGKNLVGAFWQPAAVLCDTATLASLPPREWASGRGEVAKYALLGIATELGDPPSADLPTADQVARCAAVKAAVVASDEREGDRRMVLNYGHTLAHALEASAFDDDRRPAPRRGGGRRSGVRRAAGPAPRPHRRRAGGAPPRRGRGLRPQPRPAGRARSGRAARVHGPGQEGPRRPHLRPRRSGRRRRGPWHRPGRRGRYPGGHGVHPSGSHDVSRRGLVLLLSGPNLNLLGEREPEVYGTATLEDHVAAANAAAARSGLTLEHLQSNHEGDLVEAVHGARGRAVAVIVNAGALTHTSWSLHDALAAYDGVVVELHLSNPAAREPFRHTSTVAAVSDGCIAGFGGPRVPAGRRGRFPPARRPCDRLPPRPTCPPRFPRCRWPDASTGPAPR